MAATTKDESKAPFFPGVNARVFEQLPEGLDMGKLIRQHDVRGRYRRPSFDKDGKPDGKYDEMLYPVRSHFAMVEKGFTLEQLVRDTPEPAAAPPPAVIKF